LCNIVLGKYNYMQERLSNLPIWAKRKSSGQTFKMEEPMTEEKWTFEKVRTEINEARTKMFVVFKVLETGNLKFAEHPEWALVVSPMLKELSDYAAKIKDFMGQETA
jgi:hypothetical protein